MHRDVFEWQSREILSVFNTLTLKQIFWKTKTFFKKLEKSFLVESNKIENVTFPYKTALSEDNVKTKRMGRTKQAYRKERRFTSNCFIFWKILFQYKNLLRTFKNLSLKTYPNVHTHTFRNRRSFLWGSFSLWVSLKRSAFLVHV